MLLNGSHPWPNSTYSGSLCMLLFVLSLRGQFISRAISLKMLLLLAILTLPGTRRSAEKSWKVPVAVSQSPMGRVSRSLSCKFEPIPTVNSVSFLLLRLQKLLVFLTEFVFFRLLALVTLNSSTVQTIFVSFPCRFRR